MQATNSTAPLRNMFFAIITLLLAATAAMPGHARSSQTGYVPGITLAPDVLQADGHTPVTFPTPKGLSYWTKDLPVPQGSKLKLNVHVATGGDELGDLIIRLDNTKIAEIKSSPWNTVIDTNTMSLGYHMIEVWAQSNGKVPESSTKTFSFYVSEEAKPRIEVKGSIETLNLNNIGTIAPDAEDAVAPSFLADASVDPSAGIALHATAPDIDQQLNVHANSIKLSGPVVFSISKLPGSVAEKYAYALVRDGRVVVSSSQPASIRYMKLRLQPRTEEQPGLQSGPLTLWVWGIDRAGHRSDAVRQDLEVAGSE